VGVPLLGELTLSRRDLAEQTGEGVISDIYSSSMVESKKHNKIDTT
jgi:hypothetical protein